MHTRTRLTIAYFAMAAALLALFALNLFWGSVALSPAQVVAALLGRAPAALTATILMHDGAIELDTTVEVWDDGNTEYFGVHTFTQLTKTSSDAQV